MFLGIFYYMTSESKLPTSFQILPCFLPFFPLPRARARQVVFFFAFTSSPGVCISLSLSEIGVKTFVLHPSPFHATCLVPADCPFSPVSCWHDGPIGQAGADTPEGEGFLNKAFTHIVLNDNEMCRVGEGVKAKNEKCLTRARARTGARQRKNGRRTKTKNGRSRDGERP